MNKKGSFVLVSRDDSYCGDSVGRLNNTINFLGESLFLKNKLNTSECIIVEWGTSSLRKKINPNDKIKKILKIVEVPEGIAKKYQKDSPFSEVHAMNVGFRKSSAEFFIRIDQDTLVGDRFIEWFFNVYKETNEINWPNIAFSGRRDLSIEESLKFKQIVRDPVENKKIPITHENHYYNKYTCVKNRFKFYGAAVGAIVIQRKVFEKNRGFNENMIYMNNMDIEFINRICQVEPIYNLGLDIENDFYHQYHSRDDAAQIINNEGQTLGSRKTNDLVFRNKISKHINGLNWGLSSENLKIFRYE